MPGDYITATWVPEVGRPYEYRAFTPKPLRERLPDQWSPDTVDLVESALAALRRLPDESDVGAISVHLGRAEAGGSSMIEGHYSGARRVYEHRFDPEFSEDRRVLPVFDNWRMIEQVRNAEHLTLDEILRWHEILMHHDVRSRPGELRTTQNWIGPDPFGPRNARYVPPPPNAVRRLMDDLIEYATTTLDQPIVKAAALHTQFESIHPFIDGNGRVGRALIHWALRTHAPSVPPLALVWYAHGDRYYQALDGWRTVSDPEPWIGYFATSMIHAVEGAIDLLDQLSSLPNAWLEAAPARAGSLQRRLTQNLIEHPIVDVETATERLGATPSGFSRAARALVGAGVLTETQLPRRRRGQPRKVYEVRDVFTLLDRFVAGYRDDA